jgi:hypothetical protein
VLAPARLRKGSTLRVGDGRAQSCMDGRFLGDQGRLWRGCDIDLTPLPVS